MRMLLQDAPRAEAIPYTNTVNIMKKRQIDLVIKGAKPTWVIYKLLRHTSKISFAFCSMSGTFWSIRNFLLFICVLMNNKIFHQYVKKILKNMSPHIKSVNKNIILTWQCVTGLWESLSSLSSFYVFKWGFAAAHKSYDCVTLPRKPHLRNKSCSYNLA